MTKKTNTPRKLRSQPKPALWHLVTNQQNMLYMLAAGMVMGPAGFRDKYYADSLSLYPGWVLLFRDKAKIPAAALEHATRERKHLLPCIASFDLSDLSGPARILSRDRQTRDVASPAARKRKDDMALLVRAPLPVTLLSGINFRSAADKQAFERAANEVSNIDLFSYSVLVSEALFDTEADVELPTAQPQGQLLEHKEDTFPAFGQALGGALAMLYHLANRSDLGVAAFRLATGEGDKEDKNLTQSEPILASLPDWMRGDKISGHTDIRARLFWGVVQSLITEKLQDRPKTAMDVALAYLEGQSTSVQKTELAPRLERLLTDMRGCLGLGSGTITELLKRHDEALSRSLILFCLRERCLELLEFSHPLLSDAEYIVAGILFGARDGWLQIPTELRAPDVSAYIAYQMAAAERRGDFNLKTAPPRLLPLREFFASAGDKWNDQQKNAASALAGECNWDDCIQTCVTLAKGNLPESFERKGLQVMLPGKVKVAEQIDRNKFLHHLQQWPKVDHKIETEIRKKFINIKISIGKKNESDSLCE